MKYPSILWAVLTGWLALPVARGEAGVVPGTAETIKTGAITGAEALIRWRSGDYALGWEGSWLHGQGAIVHSGDNIGFMGLTVLAQDGRSAYFAFSNTRSVVPGSSSWVLDALNQGLVRLLNR